MLRRLHILRNWTNPIIRTRSANSKGATQCKIKVVYPKILNPFPFGIDISMHISHVRFHDKKTSRNRDIYIRFSFLGIFELSSLKVFDNVFQIELGSTTGCLQDESGHQFFENEMEIFTVERNGEAGSSKRREQIYLSLV